MWLYRQNTVTGRRKVVRFGSGGYQPVERYWVETGRWWQPVPPSGGSGVKPPPASDA